MIQAEVGMQSEDRDADSLQVLTNRILQSRRERDWGQFHNVKDMAVSLSLEAAELLELTQWRNGEELNAYLAQSKEAVGHELADVLYWTLLIAHDLDIDLREAFVRKMSINESKYPVGKARGSSRKYTELSDGE
jgi:NTP pyrophosphatase (non-canonical NTP hydrolase)